MANICYSKACEIDGHFDCLAVRRLVSVELLDEDQHAREIEESAPELLGNLSILS